MEESEWGAAVAGKSLVDVGEILVGHGMGVLRPSSREAVPALRGANLIQITERECRSNLSPGQ